MRTIVRQIGWRFPVTIIKNAKIAAAQTNQSVESWVTEAITMRLAKDQPLSTADIQQWIKRPKKDRLPEEQLDEHGDPPLIMEALFDPVELIHLQELENTLNRSERYLIDDVWVYVWVWWCLGSWYMKPKLDKMIKSWENNLDPYTQAVYEAKVWADKNKIKEHTERLEVLKQRSNSNENEDDE